MNAGRVQGQGDVSYSGGRVDGGRGRESGRNRSVHIVGQVAFAAISLISGAATALFSYVLWRHEVVHLANFEVTERLSMYAIVPSFLVMVTTIILFIKGLFSPSSTKPVKNPNKPENSQSLGAGGEAGRGSSSQAVGARVVQPPERLPQSSERSRSPEGSPQFSPRSRGQQPAESPDSRGSQGNPAQYLMRSREQSEPRQSVEVSEQQRMEEQKRIEEHASGIDAFHKTLKRIGEPTTPAKVRKEMEKMREEENRIQSGKSRGQIASPRSGKPPIKSVKKKRRSEVKTP